MGCNMVIISKIKKSNNDKEDIIYTKVITALNESKNILYKKALILVKSIHSQYDDKK